ncbi:hypothetical protein RBSH_02292 [Rhodopirellula baltica SH28]|uniref:Transmembrane protein n=1 Tax=Rhodopirellula baltica SH28 TaxID=993517 RepID=K5DIX0_RHOBT|nr:hypothetical protein [Rhodopirellula baltica]EKK02388.1 hypothetical protein RBSH_02292 [Rhodopirellula baltica SH28]
MNTTSKSDSEPTLTESVADMIERLGEPPADIWDRLVDDAEKRSSNSSSPDADAVSLRSASHLFWQTHGINYRGQLARLDVEDSMSDSLAIESERGLEVADDGASEELRLSDPVELVGAGSKSNKPSNRKLIWIGVVAGVAFVGAALYWWTKSSPQVAMSSDAPEGLVHQHRKDADVFSAGFIETDDDSAMELSNLMETVSSQPSGATNVDTTSFDLDASEIVGTKADASPSTGQATEMTTSAFSLDALIPSQAAATTSTDGEISRSIGNVASDVDESSGAAMIAAGDADRTSFGGGEEADVMSDGDQAGMEADAVTASTEESSVGDSEDLFVSLPPIPSGDVSDADSSSWPLMSLQDVALRFPSGVTEFKIGEARPDVVSIIRPSDEAAIAEVHVDDEEQATRFKWLSGSRNADRSSLIHGRMEVATGRRVYMRPSLQSDAIAIDLAERDVKMKWDLSAPPEPKQARITMELQVPDEVDVGWVEPIENESPRKVRGIAVLSQQDSESVAVVVRVDVQTTRMMTVRVRFGARLDPSMPWQWTDREDVSQTLAVVTRQMEMADLRHAELEAAVSRAESSRARRLEARLDQQLDQLESQQKSLKMFAERLAELDQLIAMLAGQANLEAELFVSWPDDEQPILRLTSTDG